MNKENSNKKPGCIFGRKDQPQQDRERLSAEFLKGLLDTYEELTAPISDLQALNMRDTPERAHFLLLLQIADYIPLGKSKAIIYAYKLGYLDAQHGGAGESGG